MKNFLKIFLSIVFILCSLSLSAQFVNNHEVIFQGNNSQPSIGQTFTDPKFHTPVKRLTNARSEKMNGFFPDYSKRQAWNADESLMMLRSGKGDVYIYNGLTYQYIQVLSSIEGVQDIFWHPTNPQTVYYILDNVFYSMNVLSAISDSLFTFSNYAYVTTRAEGNISNDGHYIALCGYDTTGSPVDFFVYDIFLKTIHSTFSISNQVSDFDWISISPLGNYVVVDYASDTIAPFNGLEVYDHQFHFLWRKPLGAGHSDLGLDTLGTEVLIMDVYDSDDNLTYINKYALSDGNTTRLLSLSAEFDLHESCRAMGRPGWVYVSTFDFTGRLTDDSLSWLPFEDEIFALNMNGSGEVQRYAHHHSKRYSPSTPNSDSSIYFAEPHATVSRSGQRILFGSNWRSKVEQDTSVDAYLIDLRELLPAGIKNVSESHKNIFKIYPNPASDELYIQSKIKTEKTELSIYNLLGEKIKKITINNELTSLSISDLAPGLYGYQIRNKRNNMLDIGKIMKD